MYGIICTDDLNIVGHSMFMNYRMALYNAFGIKNFKDVHYSTDLEGCTHLFIIDEHFRSNLDIWSKEDFIKVLNDKNIKVIIFNSEKIYIKAFPWNVEIQEKVKSIKSHVQFVCDIDEARLFGMKEINKFFISKSLIFDIPKIDKKLDRILFIGQIEGEQYRDRRKLLEDVKAMGMQVDINNSQRKLSYRRILELYNSYKYVLCPIGTGKWFSYRHYEVTRLGSIPIQQVTEDMIEWFDELQDTSIFFTNVKDIENKINNFKLSGKEIVLEDYFNTLKLTEYL